MAVYPLEFYLMSPSTNEQETINFNIQDVLDMVETKSWTWDRQFHNAVSLGAVMLKGKYFDEERKYMWYVKIYVGQNFPYTGFNPQDGFPNMYEQALAIGCTVG